jgi:uncharacterized protein YggT (Ycf19 family)
MINWVDLILNLAALLLWLNWRAGKVDPLGRRTPATLVGTLRRAEPSRIQRWQMPLMLGGILFLRAVLYWLIGSGLGWVGTLNLGVISPTFRCSWFGPILLFSFLSFTLVLGVFYSWLILLSLLEGPKPIHGFVRMQLGGVDDWPRGVKICLPFVVTAVSWWLVSGALVWMRIIPPPVTALWRVEESLIIAAQAYLIWKFPAALLLVLHLLNSYIYFGRYPVWNYADVTAQVLLRPFKSIPTRLGKVDFAPVMGIVMVFLISEPAGHGLKLLYKRLAS